MAEPSGPNSIIINEIETASSAKNGQTDNINDEVNLRRCVTELTERSKLLSARNSLAAPKDSAIIADLSVSNSSDTQDIQNFVTVIEVKENKDATEAEVPEITETTNSEEVATNVQNLAVKTEEPSIASSPIRKSVVNESSETKSDTPPTIATKPVAATRSRYENVVIETRKTSQESIRLTDEPSTPSATSTFTGGSVLATAAIFNSGSNANNNNSNANDMLRKKIPPRPPPKYAGRRAAAIPSVPVPAVSSPKSKELKSSSLERNLKPSDMLRQGSTDSLDIISEQRRSEFEPGKLFKSDSRSSVSSTPHELRDDKSSSSGSKEMRPSSKAGSKESIGSIDMAEKAKSYGSLSSLNSDGLKTSHGGEHEHHYDTVPNDNGEGDYVYIQPNAHSPGNPSASAQLLASEAGTLPLASPSIQQRYTSSLIEPDSPGRDSNYVNIDYFLQ